MNILFVHNNFPAQFRHVARALATDPKMRVVAIGSSTSRPVRGVRLLKYGLLDGDVSATHPFARRFDLECRRAEQVLYILSSLSDSRFVPDVIVAHPGWGETLPLRSIFPKARILAYCEFFYGSDGRDVGFDPEFPETGTDGLVSLHLKNASTLLALNDCDSGVAPTKWQRSTFPSHFQEKISVLHEGVDASLAKPLREASVRLSGGPLLKASDEVVTFAARNLEPLRGYHIFMRALPQIMARRPNCQVLIIGGHDTSYGVRPPPNTTWKSLFLGEIAQRIDARRVHFLGHLSYSDYLRTLQISSLHVYLTYPFVLSWSLLEAMSAGCVVIGSDTAPVREVIEHEKNGLLVPFFDYDQLANRVIDVLANRGDYGAIGCNARQTILDNYDLERICLPNLLTFIRGDQKRPPVKIPDRNLEDFLKHLIQQFVPEKRAMILVAYQIVGFARLPAGSDARDERALHPVLPNDVDNSIRGLLDELAAGTAIQEGGPSARYFWSILALLLHRLMLDAASAPSPKGDVIDLWTMLADGGRYLESALKRDNLWTDEEKAHFPDLAHPRDGVRYVVSEMVPKAYRGDPRFEQLARVNGWGQAA